MAFQKFPIYQTQLQLAQGLWSKYLYKGAKVIDATCGNGKDSLYLAKHILENKEARLYCIDIQEIAIRKTKELLKNHLSVERFEQIEFYQHSFETFPESSKNCEMIVYNLGYLPGGDKSITTLGSKTLKSLQLALDWIKDGGVISLTCYRGHQEGQCETQMIEEYLKTLDPKRYIVCSHPFLNRIDAPIFILIQKAILTN